MSMSKLVRTSADLLFPFIFVFGFYVVLHGHLTPGGGFQGGAVLATGFILLFVANRIDDITALFTKVAYQNSEAVGLSLFIGTALVAIGIGEHILHELPRGSRRTLRPGSSLWDKRRISEQCGGNPGDEHSGRN